MQKSKPAVINYYAKLLKRGTYKIEQIPEKDREDVLKVAETLPEPEFDPVTQTPAEE